MDPLTITAAAQAAGGIVQGITGAFQKGKAKRMARANKRPTYRIQRPVQDNQELVESRAGQGISDATRQHLRQDAERGLTTSIDAILAGGGSVNNIADLYGNYTTSISKMALVDEEMRTRNIQNMIIQNNKLAAEKDKEWQVNVYAPYADKAQAAAALSKHGSDNMWKGINSVISAGANYAAGKQYEKEGNNVYGRNGVTGNNDPINTTNVAPPGGDLSGAPSANPWNWYTPESNVPTNPLAPQPAPANPEQSVQLLYPGLMLGNMGNGGFDQTLFGG